MRMIGFAHGESRSRSDDSGTFVSVFGVFAIWILAAAAEYEHKRKDASPTEIGIASFLERALFFAIDQAADG